MGIYSVIGEKILQACKADNVSLKAVCDRASVRYSTLDGQIRNGRPIPFSTIDLICRELRLPLQHFSESQPIFTIQGGDKPKDAKASIAAEVVKLISHQAQELAKHGHHIDTDDVINWLEINNYTLNEFSWLKDSVDLFSPVTELGKMPEPLHIGSRSLAALYFKLGSPKDYNSFVEKFDQVLIDRVSASHFELQPNKYSVTDQSIDTMVNGTRTRGTYRRTMARVHDRDGKPYNLVFSKLIKFLEG